MEKYKADLSEESQSRLARGSVLRILDSKQEKDQSILSECPSLYPYLSEEDKKVTFGLSIDL